jgi:hypothetical protein
MTTQTPNFLGLAQELRGQIYHEYFMIEGGYVFDHSVGRLRAADGRENALALLYVNRQINAEAKGLPLRLNAVNFATFYSEVASRRACRFNMLMYDFWERVASVLYLRRAEITPGVIEAVAMQYEAESHGGSHIREALHFLHDREERDEYSLEERMHLMLRFMKMIMSTASEGFQYFPTNCGGEYRSRFPLEIILQVLRLLP